jgi:hypothetical protein
MQELRSCQTGEYCSSSGRIQLSAASSYRSHPFELIPSRTSKALGFLASRSSRWSRWAELGIQHFVYTPARHGIHQSLSRLVAALFDSFLSPDAVAMQPSESPIPGTTKLAVTCSTTPANVRIRYSECAFSIPEWFGLMTLICDLRYWFCTGNPHSPAQLHTALRSPPACVCQKRRNASG